MASFLAKKVSILKEFINFLDIFFKESIAVLFDCSNINKYAINLEPGKQLLYRLIYSLSLVKLETLKTYLRSTW